MASFRLLLPKLIYCQQQRQIYFKPKMPLLLHVSFMSTQYTEKALCPLWSHVTESTITAYSKTNTNLTVSIAIVTCLCY